ncbi:MAG: hypothetical protein ABFR33_05610 [Verrucomicrobiota bacterium]
MKKAIIGVLLTVAMANPLFGYVVMSGNDTNLCANAPKLPYDIAFPDAWLSTLDEAFVIPPPAGYAGCEPRVCLKLKSEGGAYWMYTLDEAYAAGYTATKVDGDSRTEIPQSVVTHSDHYLAGDPIVLVDGDTIYLTGWTLGGTTEVIDIYESPMVPANGEDFDFTWRQTYDPSAIDPDFDYYFLGGQIAIKEGSKYVITFAGCRVPEGKGKDWLTPGGTEIQTQFYQMASKNGSGDFVWEGYPRMINGYVDRSSLNGNELGTQIVPQGSAPRTWQSWSAPPIPGPDLQINGIHLNGDIFEIDGERWYYWVWFEGGNHIASARIADGFTFADPNPDKHIWHEPVDIVQNSNPVLGEQGINENATAFKRNGIYYFIFTHGHVVGSYGMSYFMGDSFETIARGVGTEHRLYECYPDRGDDSTPLWTVGRRETAGSGRAIEKSNGDMFMFYGIGTFDRVGNYLGRKIHYSKLEFNPDGTIVPLKRKPAVGSPQPAFDPLFTDSDGVNLLLGLAGGLHAYEYNGGTYMPVGGCGLPENVVDIAAVPGGLHVVGASGLAYFGYDAATATFTEGGTYGFADATGVAIAPNGTIYTSRDNGGGLNAWTYSGGAYSADGWLPVTAMDVAVDSVGEIHVARNDGLAAYSFAGGTFTLDYLQGGAYHSGSAVYVGDDDIVRYGKFDGINNMVWNGASYSDIGFSRTSATVNDIAIGADGMWVVHNGGIHLFDAATTTYKGHYGDAANHGVCLGSNGKVFSAKHNGIIEWLYTPGVGANISAGNFFYIAGGVDAIAGFQTMGTYMEWAQQVVGDADAAADPDGDGMVNRLEYYLGGNPNIDDAATILPSGGYSGGVLEYIYNRRLDAALRGLDYGLRETDSLTNSWTSVGTGYETLSGATGSYYESVTNEVPTAGTTQGFVTVEIVEE